MTTTISYATVVVNTANAVTTTISYATVVVNTANAVTTTTSIVRGVVVKGKLSYNYFLIVYCYC